MNVTLLIGTVSLLLVVVTLISVVVTLLIVVVALYLVLVALFLVVVAVFLAVVTCCLTGVEVVTPFLGVESLPLCLSPLYGDVPLGNISLQIIVQYTVLLWRSSHLIPDRIS